MDDANRYVETWRKHRMDRRIALILGIGFFPVLELVMRPVYYYFRQDWVLNAFMAIWLAVLFVFLIRNELVVCPRCGKRFNRSERIFGPMRWTPAMVKGGRCVHCGLEKWSLGGAEQGHDPIE
jgi:hypothetical protein